MEVTNDLTHLALPKAKHCGLDVSISINKMENEKGL